MPRSGRGEQRATTAGGQRARKPAPHRRWGGGAPIRAGERNVIDDITHVVPVAFWKVDGGGAALDAGAVDEDVDGGAGHAREGLREDGLDLGGVAEVGVDDGDGGGRWELGAEGGDAGRLVAVAGGAEDEAEVGAGLGEGEGAGVADAAGCAGDEGVSAGEGEEVEDGHWGRTGRAGEGEGGGSYLRAAERGVRRSARGSRSQMRAWAGDLADLGDAGWGRAGGMIKGAGGDTLASLHAQK